MAEAMRKYRIPTDPVGRPYYRAGTMYEPGQIVVLPAGELPPGWVPDEKAPRKMKPQARHAWLDVDKVQKAEKLSRLEAAHAQIAEAQKAKEEAERLLVELEAEEPAPRGRGIVKKAGEEEEDDVEDDQPDAPPADPGTEPDERAPKGKGAKKKKAQDQGLDD